MIHLPPNTAAIQLQISSLMPVCPPVRPDGALEFELLRSGCDGEPVSCLLLDEAWPTVTVSLANADIGRGYYTGKLRIGCTELCEQRYFVGQNLCATSVPVCGDNLIGMEACEITCKPCDGKIMQRTYRIVSRHRDGGITLLADEQCIELPDCEICPECTG